MGRKSAELGNPDANIVSRSPEELASIWDEEIEAEFSKLTEKQQRFLLVYLRTGNAAEAYRRNYNLLATPHLASVAGSNVLASIGMQALLNKLAHHRTAHLLLVQRTFREMAEATRPQWRQNRDGQWENAGDVPDWKARKDGADGLARINGLYGTGESPIKTPNQSRVLIVEYPKKNPVP